MTSLDDALQQRMARPQRHRLLQGYPPVPLMREAGGSAAYPDGYERAVDGALWFQGHERIQDRRANGVTTTRHVALPRELREPAAVDIDATRALIVGVIPHTMCCPTVRGCGFCTFPHDAYFAGGMKRYVREVRAQCADVVTRVPALRGRRVSALYFGGGTANLTPVGDLAALFDDVAGAFDVSGAEVTLEGVPSLFVKRSLGFIGEHRLSWLASLPVRHKRISMGIQTFDDAMIERMGRKSFGDHAMVARVVRAAHDAGMTASGDFLFNLPSQPLRAMLDDVERAVASGLDQICVYHLVAYEGLGTKWSADPAILAALPSTTQAAENFLAVRDALLACGYVQTTLTNFEKRAVHASDKRFLYEELSFTPFTTDAVGIGPLAISTLVDTRHKRGVKVIRGKRNDGLWFRYDADDLALLFFVRSLARLSVPRAPFRDLFGPSTDIVDTYRDAFDACTRAGLVAIDDEAVRLTPRGMFYADAVVGLVTAARAALNKEGAAARKTSDLVREHGHDFMG